MFHVANTTWRELGSEHAWLSSSDDSERSGARDSVSGAGW
jgi:hypothetical protein